jgi:hypothetical protein
MFGSDEDDVGNCVCRPRRFQVHDVKHGNVVSKASVLLDCAQCTADANIGIEAETVHSFVLMQVIVYSYYYMLLLKKCYQSQI